MYCGILYFIIDATIYIYNYIYATITMQLYVYIYIYEGPAYFIWDKIVS